VAEDRTLYIQTEDWTPDIVVISLGGELDLSTVARLAEVVEDLIARKDVIVDLSGLQYIDSTAIAALAQLHNRAVRLGRRLILAQPSLFVQRILDLTSLRHAVIVYPEVAVALDALREKPVASGVSIREEPMTVGDIARDVAAAARAADEWVKRVQSPATLDVLVDMLVQRLIDRVDRGGAEFVTEEQFYDILFGDAGAGAVEGTSSLRHATAAIRSLFNSVIAPQLADRLAERNHPRIRVTRHVWIRVGHWDVTVAPR